MDKQKGQVLQDYIKFRQLRNHSRTIFDIEFHVKKFIEYSKKPLSNYDEKILIEYFNKISPNYKTTMLNNIKSAYIKNFIKWYFADWSSRFRHLDIICRTEKPGDIYKSEDMIKEEDFKKLIQGEESHFWKAYFLTLFYGASRPVEIASLRWENVEFEGDDGGAWITIYSKKNKRNFIKYVPQDVAFYLRELKSNGSEYVFLNNKTKKPITKKGAYWRIRKLSKKVLGYSIDLYTLRHSIATIIYNHDDDKDDDVAIQMGHTKSQKGRYVHNDKDRLKAIAKKIYVKPEELPPEKKLEYDRQIEELKKQLESHAETIKTFDGLIYALSKGKQGKLLEDSPLLKYKLFSKRK